MKITIINPSPDEEEEIIIKCRVLTDDINHLICKLKNGDRKITGYDAKGITLLALPDIFYFEATDNKVFAYGQKNVYEVKEKLYQLEEQLVSFTFMPGLQIHDSKSGQNRHLSPAFGGRFEALLENKEKVIISRQYVPVLKERLGL